MTPATRRATEKRLQTRTGLGLLAFGLAVYAFHLWQHRGASCGALDTDVKVALGIAAGGLLLLPFDFSNWREAATLKLGRRAIADDEKPVNDR